MTVQADLHIHSHFSDSVDSPLEIMQAAQRYGVQCLAITDHDTVEGIAPCQALAARYGIEVIPGIELSTEVNGKDIHILGYFIDIDSTPLLEGIRQFQETRVTRIQGMIEKLRHLGVNDIDFAEVASLSCSDSVGRMHLAMILAQKGWVYDIKDAFEKYIGEDGPAYIPKWKLSPADAIDLIKQAGGAAVLAHPMMTSCDELIPGLVKAGLDGLEVFYPYTPVVAVRFYTQLAEKHHLVTTGGSDSHGSVKPYTHVGKVKIPYEKVEELRQRAGWGKV